MAEHPLEQERAFEVLEAEERAKGWITEFDHESPEGPLEDDLLQSAEDFVALLAAYEDRSKAFEDAAADCVRLEGVLRHIEPLIDAQFDGHANRFEFIEKARKLNEALDTVRQALQPRHRDSGGDQDSHAEHLREAREVEQRQEEKHGV